MNRLLPKLTTFFLILLGFAFPVARVYAAASIQFSPTSVSAQQNTTFTINVSINTDGTTVTGSDATIQYASADLEFVSATTGNFFPNFTSANDATAGQVTVRGYVTNLTDAKTGTGTLSTITFRIKKSAGSSSISFACTASGEDTNIVAETGQNILSCTSTNQVGVTYTSQATPTPTPTNTPTPTPGGNPPPTGNYTPVCASLAPSVSQGTGTPLAVTFTCSGTDQFGDITAAYFDFGDTTTDTIFKNVGSPGSITTTHTYTTIGALGASCRVRDNDQTWSSVSPNCKTIITINPVKKTATTQNQTVSVPTPTPTPQVVAFVYETPTPTPEPITPIPTEIPQKATSVGFNFWIIPFILVAVGSIMLFLSRSKKPPVS